MVDISQRITENFPVTEKMLIDDTDYDYAAAKLAAIESAKLAAYGAATVPAEGDIPDIVGQWIGDKATIDLIGYAKDYVAYKKPSSKSDRQGETIRYPDKIRMLDGLKDELETDCANSWELVEDIIGRAASPQSVPTVSTAGLMVNPTNRAILRGIPS